MKAFLLASLVLLIVTPSFARDRCAVRVVKTVGAEEAPESVMERGRMDYGPITQVRVNKKTGKMVFCAHGSYCYAASAFEFISPCRLSPDAYDDPDDFYFEPQ